MSESRLLIDLGNSRAKWLWARGRTIDSDSSGRGDMAALAEACRAGDALQPDAVLISSVASPARTGEVRELCLGCWGVEARLLRAEARQGGVRNGYAEPGRLGVDRWLAIVGAVERYGAPLVVWDLGTATTLDAVDASGQHLGGWILPGPSAMLDALRNGTQLRVPPDLRGAGPIRPGRSTAECIARGVLAAQAGALAQLMQNVSRHAEAEPLLVVTGGAAADLLPLLDVEHIHDPWLVFRGMLVD
jgi:type III pantothenate kinase